MVCLIWYLYVGFCFHSSASVRSFVLVDVCWLVVELAASRHPPKQETRQMPALSEDALKFEMLPNK
jgi:hypothetical protein